MDDWESVIFEIKSASNLIKRKIDSLMAASEEDGVTGMQGFVIGFLSRHPDQDVFQRDIEEEFKIRRSTATGILQLMEKNGLLERHAVPSDARLKKLVLTQKGKDRHQRFLNNVERVEREAKAGLTEQEIKDFLNTLHRIEKNCE